MREALMRILLLSTLLATGTLAVLGLVPSAPSIRSPAPNPAAPAYPPRPAG